MVLEIVRDHKTPVHMWQSQVENKHYLTLFGLRNHPRFSVSLSE